MNSVYHFRLRIIQIINAENQVQRDNQVLKIENAPRTDFSRNSQYAIADVVLACLDQFQSAKAHQ